LSTANTHREPSFILRPVAGLLLGLALAAARPAGADIFWPGGSSGDDQQTDYQQGWEDGQAECRTAPLACGVELDDLVRDMGAGETEPNDHRYNADGLLLGEFFHGNTATPGDRDWYYVTADRKNQRLRVYFLGDSGDYTNTEGWTVKVRDLQGNVLAAFDTAPVSGGSIQGNPDTSGSPVASARMVNVTLGQPGTYYISVESNEDAGAGRGYHIGARLSDTGQVTADYPESPVDTETEPNDAKTQADELRSNVAMVGVFGRTLIRTIEVTTPASEEIVYLYKNCNETNLDTIPAGKADCACDMTQVSPNGNAYVDPPNPTLDQPPAGQDCATNVDSASPVTGCLRETACVAQRIVTPQETEYRGIFDYDEDWFVYHSSGQEQLRVQICTRTECQFERLHLRVEQGTGGSPYVLFEGPLTTSQVVDLGVVSAGDYYFHLSAEEIGVNSETGDAQVDPILGPYDILLMGTGQKPNGGTQSPVTNPPEKKPEPPRQPPPPPDDEPDDQLLPDWLQDQLGG